MTALFRRLDLRSIQCRELTIITHVKISSRLAKRIIALYRGNITRDTPRSAIYGTIYKVNKIHHVVRADVWHAGGNEYHVEFTYEEKKVPRPPKNIKSPQLLVDLLNEEPQDIELTCYADFAYKQDEWRSIIEVPIDLKSSKESEEPFTHIEAVKFSRRKNEHIEYTVEIERLENGTTIHSTNFDELWKGKLTEKMPKLLLERSSKLSKVLVSRKRRRKYGS